MWQLPREGASSQSHGWMRMHSIGDSGARVAKSLIDLLITNKKKKTPHPPNEPASTPKCSSSRS